MKDVAMAFQLTQLRKIWSFLLLELLQVIVALTLVLSLKRDISPN